MSNQDVKDPHIFTDKNAHGLEEWLNTTDTKVCEGQGLSESEQRIGRAIFADISGFEGNSTVITQAKLLFTEIELDPEPAEENSDLAYVILDDPVPEGLAAAVASYPANNPHPQPTAQDGSTRGWCCQSGAAAAHFLGYLQSQFGANIHVWMFVCARNATSTRVN